MVAASLRWTLIVLILLPGVSRAAADQRLQAFDTNPNWEGFNNRAIAPAPRDIEQDFGYSPTLHACGSRTGEIGGLITPAAEPAYYATKISRHSFGDRLSASGTLACTGREFHLLLGFFNVETLNEWRTPNTIAIRLYGRGDVFYAYLEYATARWRAGGDAPQPFGTLDPENGRITPHEFAARGAAHRWTLEYDPDEAEGHGAVVATIGEKRAVCHLQPGHKTDGASFNRFGLVNVIKSADGGGEVWFDDLTINGRLESFDTDPRWDAKGNRRRYATTGVRPRFDFGYSETRHAGGASAGEIGGVIFRGDIREPGGVAYYADRVDELALVAPLSISGKLALSRGVSDSTTLLGFFRADTMMSPKDSQASAIPAGFMGIAITGPSREGFYCYPICRTAGGELMRPDGLALPRIYPNGASHDFSLVYEPHTKDDAAENGSAITLKFDGATVSLPVTIGDRGRETILDRFGIVTTWIDGNAQTVYFDDLRYTNKQD